MLILVFAVVNAIAALFAHEVAYRKGRSAGAWTFATAIFAPALALVLLLPRKADVETAPLPESI